MKFILTSWPIKLMYRVEVVKLNKNNATDNPLKELELFKILKFGMTSLIHLSPLLIMSENEKEKAVV